MVVVCLGLDLGRFVVGEYEKLGMVAGLVPDSVSDETAPYAEMTEEYQRSLEAFRETTGLLGATGSQLTQWAERMFRLLEAQKAQVGQVGMQYAQALKSFDTARGEFAQLSPELMTPAEKESLGQIKVVYKNGEMMSGAELVDSIAAERNLRREALAGQALKVMNKALGEFSGTVERLQSEIGSVRNSPEVVHGVPSNGTWGIMGVLRGIGVSGGGGGRGLGGGGGFGGSGGLPGVGVPGGPSMPGVPGGSGLRGGVLPGGP
ncbi:hypothetical protein, partial [Buchananella hordeovulneris]|uniref:hypothetical protein n=1 Tax=Buchananella hordeovulneris TaxID=52770 RepID=UPI0013013A6B